VSFAYNLGVFRLEKSTLLKRILQNQDDENIMGSQNMKYQEWGRGGQFIKWNKVDGETNKGLVRRRKAEAWLYATGANRFFEEMLGDRIMTPEDYVRFKKI
jgi:GH24 family phage-related lysozyme (muramidase)